MDNTTVMEKMVIPDNVEIPYPETELEELRAVVNLHGVRKLLADNSGVPVNRIREYARVGHGQKGNIDKLRAAVKTYKQTAAK